MKDVLSPLFENMLVECKSRRIGSKEMLPHPFSNFVYGNTVLFLKDKILSMQLNMICLKTILF
jgi:hypothetical protein